MRKGRPCKCSFRVSFKSRIKEFESGPAPRGAFWSRVPLNHSFGPPSEDCAPKKVTGLVPLECSSGFETPLILISNPVFAGKNRSFADFATKTFLVFTLEFIEFCAYFVKKTFLFLVITPSLSNSRKKIFLLPPKNYKCPPPTVTLLWHRARF